MHLNYTLELPPLVRLRTFWSTLIGHLLSLSVIDHTNLKIFYEVNIDLLTLIRQFKISSLAFFVKFTFCQRCKIYDLLLKINKVDKTFNYIVYIYFVKKLKDGAANDWRDIRI